MRQSALPRSARAPPEGRASRLPVDSSLLGRIHVFLTPGLEQKCVQVPRQELSRLRIHDIQPVVVDEHGLLFEPLPPALFADLRDDALPHGAGKRGLLESLAGLPTAGTGHISHTGKLAGYAVTRAYCTLARRTSASSRI